MPTSYFLQTGIALLGVSLLAALVLRLLRRRESPSRAMRVLGRLELEPRRSVYGIAVAGRYWLVGVGDGPISLLAELDPAQAAQIEAQPAGPQTFAALVRRTMGLGQ